MYPCQLTEPPVASREYLLKQLEKKIRRTKTCWVWTGSCYRNGYGRWQLRDSEGAYRNWTPHRLSWYLHFGYLPNDLVVMHHCDNRLCVRIEPGRDWPDTHLFVGTQAKNLQDMVARGRAPLNGRNYYGERNGNSKLVESEVVLIRAAAGSQREIARQFGISPSLVREIQKRRVWKHV